MLPINECCQILFVFLNEGLLLFIFSVNREEAVKKINTFLKTNKLEEAVAMLRASR